jgi:hypothetical protein
MGRRSFKHMSRRRQGGAGSSAKTLNCPICHENVPLNEYKLHINKCREQASSDKSNSSNVEPSEEAMDESAPRR